MKKTILSLTMFCCLALGASALESIDKEYSLETIYENYQVVYIPSAKSWSLGGMNDERIVLTKKISVGSGSYSEFFSNDKKEPEISLGSEFEFLYKDNLIIFDKYSLKFFIINYDEQNKKFYKRNLTDSAVQKIFNDVKIVKISEFKNNKLNIKKLPFKTKKILVLNDTPEYFYKYNFIGDNFEQYELFNLLKINKMGTIEFKHFSEDFRSLTLKIRMF